MLSSRNILGAAFGIVICLQGVVADLPDAAFSEKDFQPEDKLRQQFDPDEFVFDFFGGPPASESPGGSFRTSSVTQNTFLGTLPNDGNGQNLITLEPCGLNLPHHHPRGTEVAFVLKGEILFGVVEENGSDRRTITRKLTEGQAIVFPQGLSHFAQNVGCEQAQFLANYPHRDFGAQTELTALLTLPRETLRGTFLLDDETIDRIIAAAASQGNPSIEPVCAARCGVQVPGGGYGNK